MSFPKILPNASNQPLNENETVGSSNNNKVNNHSISPKAIDSSQNVQLQTQSSNISQTPAANTNSSIGSSPQINSLLNPSKSSVSLANLPYNSTRELKNDHNIQTGLKQQGTSQDRSICQSENDCDTEYSNSNADDSDNDFAKESISTNGLSSKLPPRKRSKVSRACDECRRKKVKCDAMLDPSSDTIIKKCTNCEKNKDSCLFTRVPLKRGPNKGFNKKQSSTTNSSSSVQMKRILSKNQQLKPTATPTIQDGDNDQLKHYIAFPQTLPNSQMNLHLQQNQQIILPPLNSTKFPINPATSNQPGMFWKVPSEMPNLSSNIGGNRRRKGSIGSTNSFDSNSSFNSSKRSNSYRSPSRPNIENSDSEEEFMNNMPHRYSNPSFMVPFPIPNQSPRQSFANESINIRNDQRPSISSILSSNSSISILPTSNSFKPPMPVQATSFIPNKTYSLDLIFNMLDNYYILLYPQYPLIPDIEIIKTALQSIIETNDAAIVIAIFVLSLESFILPNKIGDGSLSIDTENIKNAFELALKAYSSKSTIQNTIQSKIILSTAFSLLNYAIILSHFDYSIGFGIAFSFHKDWLIFKDGYDNPCFMNLIQSVVLDSLYTLYYGVPRSTTVCFAIDSGFINSFLKECNFRGNVEVEWLSIGFNLVVLNNNLQNLDSLDKLATIEVSGTEIKFMSIIKLYYDLFIYCRKMNIQQVIDDYKNTNSLETVNSYLKKHMINIELEISKISKKIINLIDEQIDDLEVTKPHVLVSLVLIKSMRILINIEILLNSVIHVNDILEFSHITGKSGFNNQKEPSSQLSTRNRSDSNSSLMNLAASTNLLDYNIRFKKMIENIQSNLVRSLHINQTNEFCTQLANDLFNSKRFEINVPRTNSIKGVESSVVIHNWIRLVNTFFSGEITKEGINGWCYL
ncbi:hypothetical protein CANINC_001395 [Pichia inconspicua]|uniref:Zn(2)-C6 fungal-type domain-containing protein n=1 Tax=Pichia inconspicua TaxID=52247 RepID=A0A4T0X3R8_9ASCO|nr:hypothetical protein CANINC_001395 [[Candida] inconspicua]